MTVIDLRFELLTDDVIIRYTHSQNSLCWRGRLTSEQYMQREWLVGVESKQCKRDTDNMLGIFHFVLRDMSIDTHDDELANIVASCETRNRKAWIAEGGELREVVSPCVGSVYTLPQHRKKGYAGKMIKMLSEYWDQRLNNTFMSLYSEVGEYYSKFGYKSHEVKKHVIPLPRTLEAIQEFPYVDLNFESYGDLIEQENAKLKKILLVKSQNTTSKLLSLDLNIDNFTWFHLRDRFIGAILQPDYKDRVYGARLDDGTDDHIIWFHDWSTHELAILKLEFSSFDSFKYLIGLALQEMADCKMKYLVLWDSAFGEEETFHNEASKYINSFEGAKMNQVNTSLGAVRMTDESTDYEWENNDKWCWF